MNRALIEVLIVDDDEIDRENVRRLLSPHYHIREASLGLAALSMARARRPDCILLDWFLTDIDAQELVRRFSRAGIPVIVITGVPNTQIMWQALQQGAQDFLLKDDLSRAIVEQAITEAIADLAKPHQAETVPMRASVWQVANR